MALIHYHQGKGGWGMTRMIGWLSWGGVFFLILIGLAKAQEPGVRVHADGSLVIADPAPSAFRSSRSVFYSGSGSQSSPVQIYFYTKASRGWTFPTYRTTSPKIRQSASQSRSWSARRFDPLIKKYARLCGLDEDLVRAVMCQESSCNPRAVSPKGAMGLMQLMPETAALMGVTNPFDVEQNIAGGVKYLKRCLMQFNQDVPLALAAYNAGPENVMKYNGCPPFAETQNYVASVMQRYSGRLYRHGAGAAMSSTPEVSTPKKSASRSRLTVFRSPDSHTHGIPVRISYSQGGKSKIIQVLRRPKARIKE